MIKQRITPFLWFDGQAEEAMHFYVSVFKNSKVGNVVRMGNSEPGQEGTVLTATFELDGQPFIALNGGPQFKFTEAISFVVHCETQQEVDTYWEKLSEGGKPGQCGWLKDKYGLSWQVVPVALGALLGGSDAARSKKAMAKFRQMTKIDIAALEKAYAQ